MESLTNEEIRTLQSALDNMANDYMTNEEVKKLLSLYVKLDSMLQRPATQDAIEEAVCTCTHDAYESIIHPGHCDRCGKPFRHTLKVKELVIIAWQKGQLSEGSAARLIGVDRLTLRTMRDEMIAAEQSVPETETAAASFLYSWHCSECNEWHSEKELICPKAEKPA